MDAFCLSLQLEVLDQNLKLGVLSVRQGQGDSQLGLHSLEPVNVLLNINFLLSPIKKLDLIETYVGLTLYCLLATTKTSPKRCPSKALIAYSTSATYFMNTNAYDSPITI